MTTKRIPFCIPLIERRPDQELSTREDWDVFITVGMQKLFDEEPGERKASPADIQNLFDEYILYQAETLGWRIVLGTEVQRRMSAWWLESSGPQKFKRFGSALALSAKRVQGKSRSPLTNPDLYTGKKQIIPELRQLFAQLSDIAKTRKTTRLSPNDVMKHASTFVKSGAFPLLNRNLDSLLQYLQVPSRFL